MAENFLSVDYGGGRCFRLNFIDELVQKQYGNSGRKLQSQVKHGIESPPLPKITNNYMDNRNKRTLKTDKWRGNVATSRKIS